MCVQPTNKWCEQGTSWNLNWPMIGETPRGREFIAGPPVIIAQQSDDDDDHDDHDDDHHDDDDDITDRDLFHEALTAPVVDLNFFNSFEDDFDDFDI